MVKFSTPVDNCRVLKTHMRVTPTPGEYYTSGLYGYVCTCVHTHKDTHTYNFFRSLYIFGFLRQGFSVALKAVLELTLQTRLALNSQRSTCLCLLSAGIKGMHHHYPAFIYIFEDRVRTSEMAPWIKAFLPNWMTPVQSLLLTWEDRTNTHKLLSDMCM